MITRRAASILAGAVAGGGAFLLWAWHVHGQYCERWGASGRSDPCAEPGDGFVLMPFFAGIGALVVWIVYDWLRDRRQSRGAT